MLEHQTETTCECGFVKSARRENCDRCNRLDGDRRSPKRALLISALRTRVAMTAEEIKEELRVTDTDTVRQLLGRMRREGRLGSRSEPVDLNGSNIFELGGSDRVYYYLKEPRC